MTNIMWTEEQNDGWGGENAGSDGATSPDKHQGEATQPERFRRWKGEKEVSQGKLIFVFWSNV